jgi:glutaredoxin
LLSVVFLVLLLYPASTDLPEQSPTPQALPDDTLIVFYHPQCPHCHDAIRFLRSQKALPPLQTLDVTTAHGQHFLSEAVQAFGLNLNELGVPLFIYHGRWRMGFDTAETTGAELLAWIKAKPETANNDTVNLKDTVEIPLFGTVNLRETSLPILTVILGLADGFNPCAMWVLVYLISIIAGVQDRRKIWWLVGSFVLASGILYFLFMTAWLNTFLLVGYTRPLTLLIGLSAIGFGINHLYEVIRNRGQIACSVGDTESRQQTMGKIRAVVNAPIGYSSVIAMFGLAFVVNSIEFICSAALPAIYTHTLSLLELSTVSYYLYILLYVLIIFGLAAFAIQKVVDVRYAAYSRCAGGVLLLGLGLWMLLR